MGGLCWQWLEDEGVFVAEEEWAEIHIRRVGLFWRWDLNKVNSNKHGRTVTLFAAFKQADVAYYNFLAANRQSGAV